MKRANEILKAASILLVYTCLTHHLADASTNGPCWTPGRKIWNHYPADGFTHAGRTPGRPAGTRSSRPYAERCTSIAWVDNTTDDTARNFNRAEHLRQHPPGTDTYTDCYGWREDAESVNSVLDETLYRSRMPAYLLQRQHLFMLGHVLARNSIARALPRRSAAPPGKLAA